MADVKLTSKTELATQPASGDLFYVVDVDAGNASKYVTFANLVTTYADTKLASTDINTLAKLNAIVADATLVDSPIVNVVEDTTPQLGGVLDAQGNKIDNLNRIDLDVSDTLTIYNEDGGEMAQFFNDGGTVPAFVQFYGASGGAQMSLYALGDSTNIDFSLITKGTGEVSIGNTSNTGILSSSGNQDLKLQTGNATTGNITITDGANGDISISPNGTGRVKHNTYDMPFVLDRLVVPVTVSNTATETSLYTFSVPANTLGTDRMIKFTAIGEFLNNTGGSEDLQIRAKYGSTTFGDVTRTANGTSASSRAIEIHGTLSAINSTSVQAGYISMDVRNAGTWGGAETSAGARRASGADLAEVSTGALNFVLTVDFATASANLSFTLKHIQLELI